MHELAQWLEGSQDYEEGVALYQRLGHDTTLKKVLAMGKSSFTANKLLAAITELHQSYGEKMADVVECKPQETSEELRTLYRERSMLHNQLFVLPSQSDRKRVAFKILSLTDKIERILYQGEEEAPAAPAALPKDRAAMMRLLTNNRAYISKNKHRDNKKGECQRRMEQNQEIEKLINTQE